MDQWRATRVDERTPPRVDHARHRDDVGGVEIIDADAEIIIQRVRVEVRAVEWETEELAIVAVDPARHVDHDHVPQRQPDSSSGDGERPGQVDASLDTQVADTGLPDINLVEVDVCPVDLMLDEGNSLALVGCRDVVPRIDEILISPLVDRTHQLLTDHHRIDRHLAPLANVHMTTRHAEPGSIAAILVAQRGCGGPRREITALPLPTRCGND